MMPTNPPRFDKPGTENPPSHLEEYIEQDIETDDFDDGVPGVRKKNGDGEINQT